MTNIYLTVCGFLLLILKVSTQFDTNIFDKFHQSDYKVKYERLELVSYNRNTTKFFTVVTFKHNRTCAATNITMEFYIDVGSKIELIVQMYKFMSNEYRYFPLRLQVNFCFAMSKNLVGLGDFFKCGNFTACPIPKKTRIRICNWKPDESQLPPFLPDGKYMIEIQMLYGSTEVAVIRGLAEAYRPLV